MKLHENGGAYFTNKEFDPPYTLKKSEIFNRNFQLHSESTGTC